VSKLAFRFLTTVACAGASSAISCTEDRTPAAAVTPAKPAAPVVAKPPAPDVIHRSHRAMGTMITISAWTADQAGALQAFDAAFREFDRLEELLTVWRETSDVSHINQAAGREAVHVAPDTMEVLRRGIEGGEMTGGKFDITFGALAGVWKFDQDQDNTIPSAAERRRRAALVDYRQLKLDPAAGTAFLKRAGMRVHLGGIGKGFAVDRATALLRQRGLTDFMVQAGGDLYVAGRHGDRPWRVGIRDPRGGPETFFASVALTDATFSTSGDYERYFMHDGHRYHHILDPDRAEPATLCRSVTVMAPDATMADVLSKGVFILGPTAGLALAERTPGVGVVIVDAKNQVHISSRLRDVVTILHPPTDAP
jgi:FAD:protein FMN transferase